MPMVTFVSAVIFGYFAHALATGYLTEIARGVSAQGNDITNAHAHYFSDYREIVNSLMLLQMIASIAGIAGTVCGAIWFTWKVLAS